MGCPFMRVHPGTIPFWGNMIHALLTEFAGTAEEWQAIPFGILSRFVNFHLSSFLIDPYNRFGTVWTGCVWAFASAGPCALALYCSPMCTPCAPFLASGVQIGTA